MSKRRFKKKYLPGPDSEQEQHDVEVDKMLNDWYGDPNNNKEIIVRKESGWRSVLIIFLIFIFVSATCLVGLAWIVQGKPLSVSGVEDLIEPPLGLNMIVPEKVNSGEIVTIVVNYHNSSNVRLIDLNLDILYPDNFEFIESRSEEPYNFDRNSWRLPAMEANSSRKLEVRGRILGSSSEQKNIEAILVYKPINFHSTFKADARAEFAIDESVLEVELLAPDNLLPEQIVDFKVIVINASELALDKVSVRLTYPVELTISTSTYALLDGSRLTFKMGPGERKEILISGKLISNPAELKEFRVEVGLEEGGRFVLQNQAVHIAGVIDPNINIELKPFEETSSPRFGEPLQLVATLHNLSTLILEDGVFEINVSDRQDLLLWNSFQLLEDYNFELLDDELGSDQKIIRIIGLPELDPTDEIKLQFSVKLIGIPYDIGASEYTVAMTPRFSAISQDLSVPLEVEAYQVVFTVESF